MARLKFPQSTDDAPEASRPALNAISQQLGFTPNSFKLMSLSPSALSGVVALQGALSRTIDARTRDVVALAVSQASGCHYCLSAHSHTAAQFNRATAEEIALARQGRSDDPKRQAAGTFARRVVEERGKVTDADLDAVRNAGYNDKQVVELVALTAQFLLSNFMNNVADTDIDFPPAPDIP
jgi:uncharacterized peroxidase-related enzyme